MNNAVYGKQMKNLRNRINVILISNKKLFFIRAAKPSYMSNRIFNSDLIPILKNKTKLFR